MAIEIRMPELSADMTEADLLAWLVKPGDRVAAGDLIAEIETDKSTVEFESPASGTVITLLVAAGTNQVAVGTVLATIDPGEPAAATAAPASVTSSAASADPRAAAAAPAPALSPPPPLSPLSPLSTLPTLPTLAARSAQTGSAARRAAEPAPGDAQEATALARRLAARAGLDLAALHGTGAGGRILKSDVEAAVDRAATGVAVQASQSADAASPTNPTNPTNPTGADAPFRAVPHTRMRRTIAKRLTEAKRDVPHFYLSVECELDLLLDVRRRLNGDDGRISINDFVVRAAALALLEVPDANVAWSEEALLYYERVDVAVAVATDGGLVTPVVRDADRKELAAISAEVRDLALRAREGRLAPAEYQGGSITISNLGMYGIDSVYPILNPPQSCIVGVGRASERPVARGGVLGVATAMTCTLSADHRVLDGAIGARLLTALKRRIEDPLEMLL